MPKFTTVKIEDRRNMPVLIVIPMILMISETVLLLFYICTKHKKRKPQQISLPKWAARVKEKSEEAEPSDEKERELSKGIEPKRRE